MSLNQLIIIVLLAGLSGCSSNNSLITITGRLNGEIPEEFEYTLPINGACSFAFTKHIQTDLEGNFEIAVSVNEPSFIAVLIEKGTIGTLLIEQGKKYDIAVNLTSNRDRFTVLDGSRKAHDIYNSLHRPFHISSAVRSFAKDSVATVIKEKINVIKRNEVLKFEKLRASGDISEGFFRLVKLDIECYYSALQATVAGSKHYEDTGNIWSDRSERKIQKAFTTEIEKMWEQTFVELDPQTNALFRSPWYYQYVEKFIHFHQVTDDSFNLDTLKTIVDKGLFYTEIIAYAKKHLYSNELEYFYANYLIWNCLTEKYEYELIALSQDFKYNFPNSLYNDFIEPLIVPIVKFHKMKVNPLNLLIIMKR